MFAFQDKFIVPVVSGVKIYMETTFLEVKFIIHLNTVISVGVHSCTVTNIY